MAYQAALIRESLELVRLGDLPAAERLADQARRSAPFDDGLILFHARMLLALSDASKAVDLLTNSTALRREPEACLTLIDALLKMGMPDRAAAIVEQCLSSFALDALADTAPLGRACLAGDHHVGWVGLTSAGQIEGSVRHDHFDQLTIAVSSGRLAIGPIDTLSSQPRSGFQAFQAIWPSQGSGPIAISCGQRRIFGDGRLGFPEFFGVAGSVALIGDRIIGWTTIDWAPHRPAVVRVQDDLGNTAHVTGTPQAHGVTRQRSAIDVDINALGLHGHRFEIELLLADGRSLPIPGSPLSRTDKAAGTRSFPMPERRRKIARAPQSAEAPAVIVPVTRVLARSADFAAWLGKIDAGSEDRILIVIDAESGREFPLQSGNATIDLLKVEGDPSLGDLLNAASLHVAPRDIVILDFRTELHGDWVSRLARAARSDGNGVVAPLSWNDAPSLDREDRLSRFGDLPLAEADSIAANENAGLCVDAEYVAAVCSHITRSCLSEIGQFDTDRAYSLAGIIQEFSSRAVQEGWRTRIAGDVLMDTQAVATDDEASLVYRRENMRRRHRGRFDSRDDALASWQEICLRRRIVQAWWIAQTQLPSVLLITLAAQGGVTKHVAEARERFSASGFRAIELKADPARDDLGYSRLSIDSAFASGLRFQLPNEIDPLIDFLKKMRVERIEFHHFLKLDPVIFEIPSRLDLGFNVTIHDYSWICPRINLIRADSYCREPDVAECVNCIRENGGLLGEEISAAALRDRSHEFLRRADHVIVPSADTENRIHRYFPNLHLTRDAWEPVPDRAVGVRPPPTDAGDIRVAIFGSIGVHKGMHLILALAEDAARRNLPIRLVIIGHTEDDSILAATGRVSITGEYADAEVGHLLAREKCSVALFPSIWPETWCYTLTHAMRAGLPILAVALGAFPERLRDYPNAALFDPGSADAKDINQRLTELAKSGDAGHNAAACGVTDKALETGLYENQRLGRPNGGEQDPRDLVVSNQAVVPLSDSGRPPVTSTIQILNLAEGIYAFSVRGTAQAGPRDGDIAVPAIRLSPAPSLSTHGKLTLLSAPSVINDWLTRPGDVVIAQISGGHGQVLLTSLSMPNSVPLSIDVRRLDQQVNEGAQPPSNGSPVPARGNLGGQQSNLRAFQPQPAPPPARPVSPVNTGQRRVLRTQVLAHIQNHGDVPFAGGGWAGFLGQRLWIEAFALTPLDNLGADALEYKGRTAGGFETPWLSNGAWCGTRGMGVPLVEFAVRLRPQLAANFDCEYSGGFFSGAIGGPARDGTLCRSTTPNDPLEAIQIRITEKGGSGLSGGSLISAAGAVSKAG